MCGAVHREGRISLILPALSGFLFFIFFGPGGFSAHPKVPAGYPGERFGQIIYSSEGLCWVASGDLPLREPFAIGTPLSDLP